MAIYFSNNEHIGLTPSGVTWIPAINSGEGVDPATNGDRGTDPSTTTNKSSRLGDSKPPPPIRADLAIAI